MRKDRSPHKKAEQLHVTSERLQGKGPVSLASFSRSFLRGDRQEYSAIYHRLDTPKMRALLCQRFVIHDHMSTRAGCSFAGASTKPPCSPAAHLGTSRRLLEHGLC